MSFELIATLLPDAVCIGICIAATVTDMRTRRIPNLLTYPSVVVGLGLNFGLVAFNFGLMHGLKHGLVPSLIGCLALFMVFLALNAIGAMGMGDVKLMAAVGALVRWPLAIWALAFVLLSGFVVSVIYAVIRGQLSKVLSNIAAGTKGLFKRKKERAELTLHHMPYALAILIGVTWAVLSRYFEWLRV